MSHHPKRGDSRAGHTTLCLTAFLVSLATSLHAQAPSVRDSTGIRIVTNPALSSAKEAFTFGATPTYRVGGLEEVPEQEFKSNQGYLRGAFLSDGRFVVTDESRIHFFDAQAKRIGILGRQGAGPEDFRYLIGICRTRGDTLAVYDSHNARNAIISPAMKVVRTFPAKPGGQLLFSSCFDDGTLVLTESDYDRATGTRTTRYSRARLDGTVANPLLTTSPARFDMVASAEEGVATAGQRFYHSAAGSTQITAYNTAGRPLFVVRYTPMLEKITDDAALARMPYMLPQDGSKPSDAEIATQRAEGLKRWKAGPHAEYWPTHGRIHVDANGLLWVQQYQRDSKAPNVWVAFATDGKMIGKLVLPEGRKEVIGFGNNAILLRTTDGDGAAVLGLHPIRRK
jgi:hypothetical protein